MGTMTGHVFANPDFLGLVEGQATVNRPSACGFRTPEKQEPPNPIKTKENKANNTQRKGGRGHLPGTEFEMHCLKGSSEK